MREARRGVDDDDDDGEEGRRLRWERVMLWKGSATGKMEREEV
jgi:hypothetical protein